MDGPLIGKRATIERRWKWCVPPLYLLSSPVFVDTYGLRWIDGGYDKNIQPTTHYRLSFVAEVVAVVTVVLSLPSRRIESDCCC